MRSSLRLRMHHASEPTNAVSQLTFTNPSRMACVGLEGQAHRDQRPTCVHKWCQVLWKCNGHNQNKATRPQRDNYGTCRSTDAFFPYDGDALVAAEDFKREPTRS